MMPFRALSALVRSGVIATLLSLAMAPAHADPTAVAFGYAPGSRQTEIRDEVFDVRAMVYEIGIGNEQSVVLVHGLGQDGARIWAPLARALKGEFHIVAVDLPGFGASDKGNKLYTPDNYAKFLKNVISNYTKGPVRLVGHSFGGAVALRYAQQYPEDVERLVLVDAAGMLHRAVNVEFLARIGLSWVQNFYPTRDGRYDALTDWVRDALGWVEAAPVDADIILASEQAREKLLQSDPVKIAGLSLALENFGDTLRQVSAPTLVVWGQNDNVSPLRVGKLLASRLANARLTVMPGSWHSPMTDNPEAFNRLMREELGRTKADFRAITAKDKYGTLPYVTNSEREEECDEEDGKEYTGEYKKLLISGCRNVRIYNAHVGELVVEDESTVTVENSQLRGLGLRIEDSALTMTGGTIMGVEAIHTENSEMDLAGVDLEGQKFAVESDSESRVFFSVTHLDSPAYKGWMHGVKTFMDGEKF